MIYVSPKGWRSDREFEIPFAVGVLEPGSSKPHDPGVPCLVFTRGYWTPPQLLLRLMNPQVKDSHHGWNHSSHQSVSSEETLSQFELRIFAARGDVSQMVCARVVDSHPCELESPLKGMSSSPPFHGAWRFEDLPKGCWGSCTTQPSSNIRACASSKQAIRPNWASSFRTWNHLCVNFRLGKQRLQAVPPYLSFCPAEHYMSVWNPSHVI